MQEFNTFAHALIAVVDGNKDEEARIRQAAREAFVGHLKVLPAGYDNFDSFVVGWTGMELESKFEETFRSYLKNKGKTIYAIQLYYIALTHPEYRSRLTVFEKKFLGKRKLENVVNDPDFKKPDLIAASQVDTTPATPKDTAEIQDRQLGTDEKDIIETPNSEHESLKYVSIGMDEVTDFQKRFSFEDINDLFHDYQFKTKGKPYSNSEGIIKSIASDNALDLRVPTSAMEAAEATDETLNVYKQLADLVRRYLSDEKASLMPDDEILSETFAPKSGRLIDPGGDFLQLAYNCYGNSRLQRTLEKTSEELSNPLARSIFQCVNNQVSGRNHGLNSLFFHHLSKIEYLSPETRAISAFLQSKSDVIRGATDDVIRALDYGLDILADETHHKRYMASNHADLIGAMYAEKAKTLFCATSLENRGSDRVNDISSALKKSMVPLGLNNSHMENPDTIADEIFHNKESAHGLYVAAYTYYHTEILRCIFNKDDPSEFFDKHLRLNEKISRILPRVACLVLTPIAGLARVAEQPEYCKKLFLWRNGSHPSPAINKMRHDVDQVNVVGTETAINYLTSYTGLQYVLKNGDKEVESHIDKISRFLVQQEAKFQRQDMKTISRYYERFRAGRSNEVRDYLNSESYPAPSHHLFFGEVEDQFTINE